jgi:hypothetical protein
MSKQDKSFSRSKVWEEMRYNHTPQFEVKEAGNFLENQIGKEIHHPENQNRIVSG